MATRSQSSRQSRADAEREFVPVARAQSILDLIGNTPLLEITRLTAGLIPPDVRIYAKLEVHSRAALATMSKFILDAATSPWIYASIAVQGLLIRYTYFHIDFFAAGMFILWIAMGMSVWSGIDYYVGAMRLLKPKPQAVPHKRAAV